MHYKIFLCVLLFPVSLSAQNGELSLTLEQSASLMNKGSHTLQMADKAIEIARSERQKMNAFWYPSLNASGAYVHLSNNIEVKEPLKQFTDPAKDFVHSIVPDDKFISSILDNIRILCAVGLAFFGFYFGRSVVDDMIYNNTKYDYAKTLIQQRDDITQSLANQSQDAELLPRTQLYCEDVINQLDTQVVKKMKSFGSYNITHTTDGDESYSIPISGTIKDFPAFIDLQNSMEKALSPSMEQHLGKKIVNS